jgi:hypothetical protein
MAIKEQTHLDNEVNSQPALWYCLHLDRRGVVETREREGGESRLAENERLKLLARLDINRSLPLHLLILQ